MHVLVTMCDATPAAKEACEKLRFLLMLRGVVVDEVHGTPQATVADAVVAIIDSVQGEASAIRQTWLDWLVKIEVATNQSLVLISAEGPAGRSSMPRLLGAVRITRLDRPLGYPRLFERLRVAPFLSRPPIEVRLRQSDLEYFPDAPVKLAEDRLGRGTLAKSVASLIREAKGAIALSVEGPWGSGKSSFMKFVQEELERDIPESGSGTKVPAFRTVTFNPWRLDKAEAVWASFVLCFYRELFKCEVFDLLAHGKRRSEAIRALRARCKLAWLRFDWDRGGPSLVKLFMLFLIAIAISVALAAVGRDRESRLVAPSAVQQASTAGRPAAGDSTAREEQETPKKNASDKDPSEEILLGILTWLLGTTIPAGVLAVLVQFILGLKPERIVKRLAKSSVRPDYEARQAFIERFHEDFGYVSAALSRKVAVFIDDLDRCEPSLAAEIIQAVNLMIPDGGDLAFVIAMDREKVAAGIAVRAEKILPILARTRLEKPEFDGPRKLQYGYAFLEKTLQFAVRLPPAQIENIARAASGPEGPMKRLVRRSVEILERNPRRVKQFMNRLTLEEHLLDSASISREQLAKFLAITIRFPSMVEAVEQNNSLLAELEEFAVDRDARVIGPTDESAFARWASEDDLLRFLAQDWVAPEPDANPLLRTFLGVDVPRLLGRRSVVVGKEAREAFLG